MEYKDILAVLSTLVAAFAGSWAAFHLENQRRKREEQDRNIGASNRAIYTLFNLWNVLENYRKNVLEPHRAKADAWLNVMANPTIPTGENTFQANELQFLLQSDSPEVYAELMLEAQRFAIAMDLISSRSKIVLEEVFPKMATANVNVGHSLTEPEIEKILGTDVTHMLKQITASIYTHVDQDLVSLKSQHEKINGVMKDLYPNRKVLQIQFELPAQGI
jgi:hypothetical protein